MAGESRTAVQPAPIVPWIRDHGFLLAALAIWVLPPLLTVAQRYWSTEQGAAGPIILVTGCWAVAHQFGRYRHLARPGSLSRAIAAAMAAGIVYILARMVGMAGLELLAAYAGMVAVLYAHAGGGMLRRLGVPLAYLVFVMPPPYALVIALTDRLKPWLAGTSVDLLSVAGLDVANSGTVLYVDGYELLVETACSGLNSLVTLCAIGVFYLYWRNQDDRRLRPETVALVLLLPAIAVVANLARVVVLLWLVHMSGVAVLSTAFHPGAGIAMFAVALMLVAAANGALRAIRHRGGR